MSQQPKKPVHLALILLAASAGLYLIRKVAAGFHEPPAMASRGSVSILSLSQNRTVVRIIGDYIQSYGYSIGGILESNPFSASELALALRVLEPRPQVMLVGRGYSEEVTDEVRQAFAQYASEAGIEKGTVVKITSKVFEEAGKDGVPEWVLGQLQNIFGK